MKDRDLKFDRKKHMLYSKTVKKVIRTHLAMHYPPDRAEALWEQIQLIYVKNIGLMPFMGGRKNSQAASVYDCAALFAYYEAVPDKPDPEEFGQMNEELFVPTFRRMGFANLNRPWQMKAAEKIFRTLSRRSMKNREIWPGNYDMQMCEVPEGTKYLFLRCPIAELAKKLGYTHLMPAMCNPDYPMLGCIGGDLIRTQTCANGSCCDFWVVGSESKALRDHPRRRNPAGYWYNL